ncbi:MAG: SprT family zinc-dependent metalloprotease [Erysipelotrichaceae bacterium]|nr:SprT family zinc-dependent metalloprotease [Erysipelotrichaceae bacterium]
MERKINFSDQEITYFLNRQKVKNINLRVKRDGSVWVSAHPHVPLENVDAFVISKLVWINNAQKKLKARENAQNVESGVRIFGLTYPLEIRKGSKRLILTDHLVIYYPDLSDQLRIQNYLREYLKKTLERQVQEIRPRYDALIAEYHHPAPEIRFRAMTSRWGSCQFQRGKIFLNTSLIYYPLVCLHYVVLHEYLHFIVPNHSARFYELMAYHMPEYKKYKQMLNGSLI